MNRTRFNITYSVIYWQVTSDESGPAVPGPPQGGGRGLAVQRRRVAPSVTLPRFAKDSELITLISDTGGLAWEYSDSSTVIRRQPGVVLRVPVTAAAAAAGPGSCPQWPPSKAGGHGRGLTSGPFGSKFKIWENKP